MNYQLPEFKSPLLKGPKGNFDSDKKQKRLPLLTEVVLLASLFGFLAGMFSSVFFYKEVIGFLDKLNIKTSIPFTDTESEEEAYSPSTFQEQKVIEVVEEVSPSVVSIVVSKDLPVYEQYFKEFFPSPFFEFQIPQYRQKGVEKRQIGGGTGFIISEEGMVLTNKHVVLDEEADYTILNSEGEKFPVKVLARDPNEDIAILKIESEQENIFSPVKLGDSDKIQRGQTAIAIGFVLGKYQNAVSVGVVSGLGRTITASGGGFYETLEDVIQTDAAVNRGNSGGPLLNLEGEVIGINTAIDVQGQNIGFAIPINRAKRDIQQVKELGKIVYPFLGVRYVLINEEIQKEKSLPVDYGAYIVRGSEGEAAVSPGSAADEAGLKEGDIILEFNGERITTDNTLAEIIMKYNPGDSVSLKIRRAAEEKIINAVLGEMNE